MTGGPAARAVLLAAATAGLLAGCSGTDEARLPPPPATPAYTAIPTFTSAIPGSTPPPITGSAEPRALPELARLDGSATGTLTLAISGTGELTSAVTGRCSPSGTGTEIALSSADGARVRVLLGDRPSVSVSDGGFDYGADLLPGDYAVQVPRLTMATGFTGPGTSEAAGRLDLDVTCG
ncbi:hypothetical protein [Actinokineospora bangkokensis]|uniref:Lipoprotein n=1 Tax=Actinokineospora bangkokensis TaxID=1193682 RepID=A0A1Q9LM63_9PSEU|nr:hypothetical protein [Actinokineospora bangkokensis]OLR93122.1 hypothetical protein BJP25_00535 [Actinokineospora bangkokensis]